MVYNYLVNNRHNLNGKELIEIFRSDNILLLLFLHSSSFPRKITQKLKKNKRFVNLLYARTKG